MRKSITLLLMAAAIAVFTGCEDDSSSKKDTVLETGNSTIRGNITYTGDIPARAVSAKVAATIPVWLKGTTTETYTDQNGNFIFENIPAGDYTICFEIGGKTYEYPISVSDGATLIISNLGVSADGTVVVGSVRESSPSDDDLPESEPESDQDIATLSFTEVYPTGLQTRRGRPSGSSVVGAFYMSVEPIEEAVQYTFYLKYRNGKTWTIDSNAPEIEAPVDESINGSIGLQTMFFDDLVLTIVHASNASGENTQQSEWTHDEIPGLEGEGSPGNGF